MYDFPQPLRLGGSTRWSPADLQEWEISHELNLAPLSGLASVKQLAARYSVSVPTIWRWAQASKLVKSQGGSQ